MARPISSKKSPEKSESDSRYIIGGGLGNPADPEVARKECQKWYYTIYPPSRSRKMSGDWPVYNSED